MTRDEEVLQRRGFPPIEDDKELIEKARELTSDWYMQGSGHHGFRGYYFSDYVYEEPYRSFTDAEFKRIKELQKIEQEKYHELYGWDVFQGKPLSEDVIIRFLDRQIEQAEKQWGKDSFWYDNAVQHKERALKEWREGKVIEVDMVGGEYHEQYLYSDGTIREQHWGD